MEDKSNSKNNYKDLELIQKKGKFFTRGRPAHRQQRIRKIHMKKIGETKYIPITIVMDEIPQIAPVLKKLQKENKEYCKVNSYSFEKCPSPKEVSKLTYELPINFYKINKDPILSEENILTTKIATGIALFVTSFGILAPYINHYPVREKTEADSLYNLERASIDKKFEHQIDLLNNSYELKVNSATKAYNIQIDSLWQAYKDNKKK